MLILIQDALTPTGILADLDIYDRSVSTVFFKWYYNILPTLLRVENTVTVYPAVPYVLYRIEDNPLIRVVDEIKIS